MGRRPGAARAFFPMAAAAAAPRGCERARRAQGAGCDVTRGAGPPQNARAPFGWGRARGRAEPRADLRLCPDLQPCAAMLSDSTIL